MPSSAAPCSKCCAPFSAPPSPARAAPPLILHAWFTPLRRMKAPHVIILSLYLGARRAADVRGKRSGVTCQRIRARRIEQRAPPGAATRAGLARRGVVRVAARQRHDWAACGRNTPGGGRRTPPEARLQVVKRSPRAAAEAHLFGGRGGDGAREWLTGASVPHLEWCRRRSDCEQMRPQFRELGYSTAYHSPA